MAFQLPSLPYVYDALEPHIDARTMEIHHTKHHQAYMDKLNDFCNENNIDSSIEKIVSVMEDDSPSVLRNNAGGYHNHMLFWENLTEKKTEKSPELREAMMQAFGTCETYNEQLVAMGMSQFGSGWVWVVSDRNGSISIMTTPNQDSPLMSKIYGEGRYIILAIDLWEHAYYLNYQNKRADYLTAIGEVINWDIASQRYGAITA